MGTTWTLYAPLRLTQCLDPKIPTIQGVSGVERGAVESATTTKELCETERPPIVNLFIQLSWYTIVVLN